ncbi:hypothetical protein ACH5RR_030108 [Cinchona calisaya]|uniref:DDE Tnp4 domain-containing protein n=1 Tax=Cinchona calisaya TaxID=153742 RepID=A0ABD2YXY5_9GENT
MAMNRDDENAMVIGVATSVLATGYVVLEFYKTHEVVPRAPHMNKDKARKDYMDCVGAIDGTHVRASVPLEIQGRFRGRKGFPKQNALATISFDLKFSYVLADWEGSAHDSRVLNDALSRPHGLRVPQGKYYLVDVGYGIHNGFIPPYHGVRYHLKEYDDNPPQNE